MNDMNATPELPAGWRRRRTAWIAAGILAIASLVYALSPRLLTAAGKSAHRIRRAIVVTSPPHTYRSRLTFIRAVENLNLQILVHPSSRHPFRGDSWWRSRRTLRDGLLEWQKLIYYRLIELPRMTSPAARHPH